MQKRPNFKLTMSQLGDFLISNGVEAFCMSVADAA